MNYDPAVKMSLLVKLLLRQYYSSHKIDIIQRQRIFLMEHSSSDIFCRFISYPLLFFLKLFVIIFKLKLIKILFICFLVAFVKNYENVSCNKSLSTVASSGNAMILFWYFWSFLRNFNKATIPLFLWIRWHFRYCWIR